MFVKDKRVVLQKIPTETNPSDLGTKALDANRFAKLFAMLPASFPDDGWQGGKLAESMAGSPAEEIEEYACAVVLDERTEPQTETGTDTVAGTSVNDDSPVGLVVLLVLVFVTRSLVRESFERTLRVISWMLAIASKMLRKTADLAEDLGTAAGSTAAAQSKGKHDIGTQTVERDQVLSSVVWISPKGSCFHSSQSCAGLSAASRIESRRSCELCMAKDSSSSQRVAPH